MQRVKALEDENTRLKKIAADLTLEREMLQNVMRRKLCPPSRMCKHAQPGSGTDTGMCVD